MNEDMKLKESWVWPDEVTEFVKRRVEGYSLCVCAGMNPVCDENIDLDPQHKDVSLGDMRKLDYDSETFDTVVSDPPWKLGYYQRFRPFFECLRVCKVGGKVVYNSYWVPNAPNCEIQKLYVRQDGEFTNASIISVLRKTVVSEYSRSRQGEIDQKTLKEWAIGINNLDGSGGGLE